jgi:hypothetical protein
MVKRLYPEFSHEDRDLYLTIWFSHHLYKGYAAMAGVLAHHIVAERMGIQVPAGHVIDHIDRDPLNCRRDNLRLATRSQNNANQAPRKDNTSGFKGVCWSRNVRAWQAQLQSGKSKEGLGLYATAFEAALAFAIAARKAWGEFSWVNMHPNLYEGKTEAELDAMAPARIGRCASPGEGKSGYRGVYVHHTGRYAAYIQHQRKKRHLGMFATADEAAQAFDRAARQLRGSRARLNFG